MIELQIYGLTLYCVTDYNTKWVPLVLIYSSLIFNSISYTHSPNILFKRLEYKYTKLIVSSNGEIELPPAETCAIGDEDEDSGDDHFHTSGEFNSFMIYNNTNI